MRLFFLFGLFFNSISVLPSFDGKILLTDEHGPSFYWFVENLPLTPVKLVHIDHHDDALPVPFELDLENAVAKSNVVPKWVRAGLIVQSFNWIRPLMFARVAAVEWIYDFDGGLANDWWTDISKKPSPGSWKNSLGMAINTDLAVSIDLDFFAGIPIEVQEKTLKEMIETIWNKKTLRAWTFAISNSWLKNDLEAQNLVHWTIEALIDLIKKDGSNTKIVFEPQLSWFRDNSIRANTAKARGRVLPSFTAEKLSSNTQSLIKDNFVFFAQWN